jgi:hypothetical protein
VQVDHHGYTFPFDDVKPSIMVTADEVSGSVAVEGVRVLRVIAGGPDGTQQAGPAPAPEPEPSKEEAASSSTTQSYSTQETTQETSPQSTGTSTAMPDASSSSDASTYATRSPDALATSTPSISAAPAPLESLTTQAPSTLVTLPSQVTAPAHPGNSPVAYSPLDGATTMHLSVVTIIETAIVTEFFTTTTYVPNSKTSPAPRE